MSWSILTCFSLGSPATTVSLDDGGFLLIRFSGTEPIVRVYTETTHPELVAAILDAGLEIAGLK